MQNYSVINSSAENNLLENSEKRFTKLVERYHTNFFQYALAITKNESIANDLLQEAYLNAWRHRKQLNDWKAFKAWFYTILRHQNIKRFARKQLELVLYEEDFHGGKSEELDSDSLKRELLIASIELLPNKYSDPMRLHIQGQKCTDIAATLNLNLNTVLTRLSRARCKIKERLTKNCKYEQITT